MKSPRVFAFIALSSVVLAGCESISASSLSASAPSAGNSLSSVSSSSPSTTTKTTIEFFGWGSAEEQENFQTMVDEFMVLNPDIKVIYSATSSDSYMTTLKNRGSSLPDVFYMPDYEFMQWADSGKLYDMSDSVTQDELNSVWSLSTDMYRYDSSHKTLGAGSLYGLPKDLGPYLLCYNKTLLEKIISEKGLSISLPDATVPMGWNTFRDYLKSLKYTDSTGKTVYGIGEYEMMHAVYSNNANYWDNSVKTEMIDSQNFKDAIQFIANLYLTDGVMPSPSDQNSLNGYQRFLTGGCLFNWIGAWDFKALWEGTDFDFDVIPTPIGTAAGAKSTSWIGSVAYSVANSSLHKDAAMRLAKFLTFSEDAAKMNYELGQAMPNVKSVALSDWLKNTDLSGRKLNPANKQLFIDTVTGTDYSFGKNRARYYLYDNTPIDDLEDSLDPVWSGSKTASQFLSSYASTFQSELDDSNSNLN